MRFILAQIVRFFSVDVHILYFRTLYRLGVLIDYQFGLGVMTRNLFQPLFGFRGIWNRLLGAIFRSVAILLGMGIIALFFALGISVYLLLTYVPTLLYEVHPLLLGFVLFGSVLSYFARLIFYPFIPIKKVNTAGSLLYACDGTTRSILRQLRSGNSLAGAKKLEKSERVREFLDLCELSHDEVFSFVRAKWAQPDSKQLDTQIRLVAQEMNSNWVHEDILFVALFDIFAGSDDFLMHQNGDRATLHRALVFQYRLQACASHIWDEDFLLHPSGGVDKGWAVGYTATLNRYSTDLTKIALKEKLPRMIGRRTVREKMIEILSKESHGNVLLIGEAGCGKTTFVRSLAREIAEGTDIPALRYKRLVQLDIGALTAGTQGEMNARLSDIIKEIEMNGNVLIFIDEIHTLSSTLNSDPNAVAAFSILEPHLTSGRFQFIGTTSRDNYVKYIQPNEAFTKNFDRVDMPEATEDETIAIAAEVLREAGHIRNVTYPAVARAIEFSQKYIDTSVLPDKAIELINEAIARATFEHRPLVTQDLIAVLISEKKGIPATTLQQSDRQRLLQLESILHRRVIGQDEAISQIAKAVKRSRAFVRDDKKPIASFLFAGPTGVGKTETAKALAECYFGSEKEMIRLDMSEYQEAESMRRLIGSESGDPGRLTSAIREKPSSLILLDEIEKAHEKIHSLFLQVLDDGRLTDAKGNTVNFSNTFIIMTTNVATREIIDALKSQKSVDEIHAVALEALKAHFAPEFLNRFSDIIPFHALSADEVFQITGLKLKKVAENMKNKHITVEFSPEVVHQLSTLGYVPEWGARPLNRLIEEKIETVLAEKLISKELVPGGYLKIDTIEA